MKTQFIIHKRRNKGVDTFMVYGRVDGAQYRKVFKNYELALADKQEKEIEAINGKVEKVLMQPTKLNSGQLAQAEVAFARLGARSLDFVIDHFLRTFKPAQVQRTVEAAVAEFIAAKTAKNLRADSLRDLRGRTKGLLAAHGAVLVNEVTPADVNALVYQPGWSPRQSRNQRRTLTNFFGWAIKQKYTSESPVDAVEKPVIDPAKVVILSLADVRKLLGAALNFEDGALVPRLVLSLFCGLRPSEIERLKWSDIDLDGRVINIEAERCKTRADRHVQIEANVALWLAPHFAKTPIQTPRKQYDKLRVKAGFDLSKWPADVLRHTAVSHHIARYNEGETSKWAGHSIAVLFKHYRLKVKKADADVYWTLAPDNVRGTPVPMSAAA